MRKRRCDKCGHPFIPKRKNQRFCTRDHRLWARVTRRNDQRYYARRERERDGKPIICAQCGDEMMFASSRSTRRYCSNKCRQAAYRQRTPSIADIRKRLDRELAHAHRRIKSERAQRLLRAWSRGDPEAAEKLKDH